MLRLLDGNLNVNGSPNENYARELLELIRSVADSKDTFRNNPAWRLLCVHRTGRTGCRKSIIRLGLRR